MKQVENIEILYFIQDMQRLTWNMQSVMKQMQQLGSNMEEWREIWNGRGKFKIFTLFKTCIHLTWNI